MVSKAQRNQSQIQECPPSSIGFDYLISSLIIFSSTNDKEQIAHPSIILKMVTFL